MNKEEYEATQFQLINMLRTLNLLDLDGFLDCISKTETLAPIIDPTLYQKSNQSLDDIRFVAEEFQRVVTNAHQRAKRRRGPMKGTFRWG